MNDLWIIFFVKYNEESLVFKDQSTRIQTSFFEI